MEILFCYGKKDFCENPGGCRDCNYLDGSGAMDEHTMSALLSALFGKGYNLDRLKELAKADLEGRIAVFPCKPSDVTVYQLRNKKHALGMGVHPRHVGCARCGAMVNMNCCMGGDVPCKDKDFGKTWFLKEDEAQAALEKMKERENDG